MEPTQQHPPSEHHHHHPHPAPAHVEIFIDKKEQRSHTPTTHAALYRLGQVNHTTHDLYEEIRGKGEDKLIPYNEAEIHLHKHEHFFSVQKKLNPGAVCR